MFKTQRGDPLGSAGFGAISPVGSRPLPSSQRAYCAPQAKIWSYHSATRRILPYKISAAGDFFEYQSVTKMILPYKISIACEVFPVSERY